MDIEETTTLEEIAKQAVEEFPGCLLEIGAGDGLNTDKFLIIAKEYNRKVLVIDPFEDGWNQAHKSYCKPYPLQKFMDNINLKQLAPWMVLLRSTSQSDAAKRFTKGVKIAFAFVDGLQTKEAILSDLKLVENAQIIVVDDMNRNTSISQTPLAVEEYMKHSQRGLIILDRYAVLIKN